MDMDMNMEMEMDMEMDDFVVSLIQDLIGVIEDHYKSNRKLSQKLVKFKQMIAAGFKQLDDDTSSQSEDLYLFFNELTPEAQIEFLESQDLSHENLDESKPIAKLKIMQKGN